MGNQRPVNADLICVMRIPAIRCLCPKWLRKKMFPMLNMKSRPTHSLISPPHLTTVVLTPLYSCWAGGRKLVKWHPPGHLKNTPNHQKLTTGRLAMPAHHAGWRLSHRQAGCAARWLTDCLHASDDSKTRLPEPKTPKTKVQILLCHSTN